MARRVIVALMGPTAAGKTDIAFGLADRLPVDLVSVDSAMIYRGMDIGTAKPARAELERHPHALIDIRDPLERYSVAEFVRDARDAVAASLERGRLPVLVGGTMMYFRAFREGIADMPATPPAVRAALARRATEEGLSVLHRELTAIDPIAAARIHPNNPQRLLRALEVFETSGRPISAWWADQRNGGVAAALDCDLVEIAMLPSRAMLATRIETRFSAMLEAGLVDEVRRLWARGDLSASLPSMRSVGYRQVWRHLDGRSSETDMAIEAVRATKGLAKRQITWLKRFDGAWQVDATSARCAEEILQYVEPLAILGRLS